jgi:hypothetical protein
MPYSIRRRLRAPIALAIIGLLAGSSPRFLSAQAVEGSDSMPPAARPEDVKSVDAIMDAAYEANSGPAGVADMRRLRSLFVPGARLIPTGRPDSAGHVHLRVLSVPEYARLAGQSRLTHANYEWEIGRTVQTFGAVTQVFSAYASGREMHDPQPLARGMNSFQLFNDGARWYIVTIYWAAEHGDLKIPAQYLNEK